MLVFYPDFENKSGSADDEVVLLLDTSESMRGESLQVAQRVALQVLRALSHSLRVNVVAFGSGQCCPFTHTVLKDTTPTLSIKAEAKVEGEVKMFPLRFLAQITQRPF